jgi:hypothetical protein
VTELVANSMKLDSLKDRIARADYAVDTDAVAEALIRRVTSERTIVPLPPLSRRGARTRPARAARRPS